MVRNVKIGTGVVYRGTANTNTIPVIGKKLSNGALLSTPFAKVVSFYGSKRLTVVGSTSSTTPNAQGGQLRLTFAPNFTTGGANVVSLKVSNITTTGAKITLYPLTGTARTVALAKTGAGITKTITLNASGIRALEVYARNAFASRRAIK